jgi:hypothetical protein
MARLNIFFLLFFVNVGSGKEKIRTSNTDGRYGTVFPHTHLIKRRRLRKNMNYGSLWNLWKVGTVPSFCKRTVPKK